MSGELLINSRPRRLNGIKSFDVWEEMVLYSQEKEMTFSLNHSARAIWDLCDGQRTLADICQELSQNFDRSNEELRPDVETTIAQLCEFGLLTLE